MSVTMSSSIEKHPRRFARNKAEVLIKSWCIPKPRKGRKVYDKDLMKKYKNCYVVLTDFMKTPNAVPKMEKVHAVSSKYYGYNQPRIPLMADMLQVTSLKFIMASTAKKTYVDIRFFYFNRSPVFVDYDTAYILKEIIEDTYKDMKVTAIESGRYSDINSYYCNRHFIRFLYQYEENDDISTRPKSISHLINSYLAHVDDMFLAMEFTCSLFEIAV